jgi:hypothetical protein
MKIGFSKSFIHGFIRGLDLSGTKDWPQIDNGKRADYEAIKGDWENVGRTIRKEAGNLKRI